MLDDSKGKLDNRSLQRIIGVWLIKSLGSNVAGKEGDASIPQPMSCLAHVIIIHLV